MKLRHLLALLTAALLCMTLCLCLAACNGDQPDDTADETTAAPADTEDSSAPDGESTSPAPDQSAGEDTTAGEPETTAPAEVFKPDPDRAVPKYDALMEDLDSFPLSFKYDKTAYNGFEGFTLESETYENVDRGVKSTLILRHPEIPAAFRLEATVYPQESAYEYVVYIVNDGEANTGVFSNLRFSIEFKGDSPVISGIKGDAGGANYTPYTYDLTKRNRYEDRSTSGRPSHGVFPYYNLSYGNGGTFIAIGWPGTWYAQYNYKKSAKITTLECGQGSVSTYVAPGETLRTPLMGFVEYEGLTPDEQTNAWRHYYINDVMRKIDGELTPTYVGVSNMSQGMTTKKELLMLKAYKSHGIVPEFIWMDAGWYTGANGEAVSWPQTGSMDIDYSRFPDGMADIGKFAADNDSMFLLWFEPENMRLDTEAFLTGQPDFKEEWLFDTVWEGSWLQSRIINLGIPECREWVFNKICKVIDTTGATGYRQDFNTDPVDAWNAHDAKNPNRKGMAENQYVQGYLALWDAIIDKYGIFIDSCASGGGRNDLESMKRAVPLHYTDWFDGNHEDYDMKGKMTQELFKWFPYFKNEVYENTLYKIRMNYAPFCGLKVESALDKDTDWELLKQGYDEFDLIRGYFYDDYYTLTEWTQNADRWDARMFFNPETGEGFASIACQEASTTLTKTICLKGLDPDQTYNVKDLDGLVDVTASGKDLMEKGITVTVPENPYCVIALIKSAN